LAKTRDGGHHQPGMEKQAKIVVAGRVNVGDRILALLRTITYFYLCTLSIEN